MTVHTLKTIPPHFEDVREGRKTVEVRLDDRDYAVGDELRLLEWIPLDGGEPDEGRFTGRGHRYEVMHVLRGFEGIATGWVAMSIKSRAIHPCSCGYPPLDFEDGIYGSCGEHRPPCRVCGEPSECIGKGDGAHYCGECCGHLGEESCVLLPGVAS